jgi:hypothetical protein
MWREKRIVGGLFLDVKSAYPTVYRDWLVDRLQRLQCPSYLISIIRSFLTDRSTSMKLGDYVSQNFSIPEGLPQGSPLSVTLYILYNSNLLINNSATLQDHRISIGYVDDVVHLVAAETVEQAVKMLHEEATRSLEWWRKLGAIFDRKKATLMMFSPKTVNPPPFDFDGQVHQFVISARWLGIILDQRLTFSEQVQKAKKAGNLAFSQLGQVVKSTYGLNTKLARRLVISVVYPWVIFGSIVWYTQRTTKAAEEMLEVLYHQACRLITGLFRQTPTVYLKKSSGLLPFSKIHTRQTHSCVLKALTYPSSHPVSPILKTELTGLKPTFPSPIHSLISPSTLLQFRDSPLETIQLTPAPPWVAPLC